MLSCKLDFITYLLYKHYKPHSNKLLTRCINIFILFQKAQGHTECRVDFINYPNPKDNSKKLHIEFGFTQIKYYSGNKINLNLFVTKVADNILFKFITNHQDTQTASNTAILVQYAPGTWLWIIYYFSLNRYPNVCSSWFHHTHLILLCAQIKISPPNWTFLCLRVSYWT